MPDKKGVLPLGSLCVEAIAQQLVDIVQMYPNCHLKEADTKAQQVIKPNCTTEQNINGEIIGPKEENKDINQEQNGIPEIQAKVQTKEKEENAHTIERLDVYRKEFVKLLTSHANGTLHRKVFTSLVSRVTEMYMTKKSTRPIIQDIMPHFLNSALREFDFGTSRMFAEAAMCQVLSDHIENASRLETLDIGRSCYWRQNVFEKLSSKLRSLPHLRVLRIQYICTPEMLTGLVDNCPDLCELNLKGSERITDEECDEIAKCLNLKSLDITGTKITGKGCLRIIESIKNLSWLYHCAFNCNSDALLFESRSQLYDCIKEQANRREDDVAVDYSKIKNVFNLKFFWLFNPRSEDLFSTLLCPHLEHLRLDFIFQDVIEYPDVDVLSQIPKLNNLQVNLYDRCVVDLVTRMIESCGSKLTSLDLHFADDYFFAALVQNVVARCCPNLVSLRFSGDYKARHSLNDCDSCLDFDIPSPAHPHLEHFSITGVVTDCRLRFIWSHAPAVRTLCFDGELEWLHDYMFKSLLDSHPLPDLERVWFNVSTTVTLRTVRRLLLNDNSIHTIGRLCHMAEADVSQYQELQDLVRQNNLDVKLIWVTDERHK